MIEVELASLAVDSRGQPVVVLRAVSPDVRPARLLPIWIGVQEATAIMLALEGAAPARPMSYDLMVRLLERLQASVRSVAVTALDSGTFYAEITLDTPTGVHVVDARPSDSVALAVRTDAPIFVAESVMAQAGLAEVNPPSEDDESQLAEFSEFLDTVNPDDFRG